MSPRRSIHPLTSSHHPIITSSAALLALGAAGCRAAAPMPAKAAPAPEVAAPVRLTDVAASAGVRFRHEFGSQRPLPIVETMGSGCAFLDYDNDGWQDLFLVSSGQDFRAARQRPGCRLFHNEGAGQFTDATQAAGIAVDTYAMGCCTGDYDNDGYLDLFVSGYGRNVLLHNAAGPGGRRVFRDVTRAAGLRSRPGQWGTGCAFADLEGNGWLDLYVANYVRYNPALPLCPTARVMSGCTPSHYETQPNELYVNQRDGTFIEQARAAGADDPAGAGLGVVVADFDNDGRPDIFIANDGTPNALLHNETGGRAYSVVRSSYPTRTGSPLTLPDTKYETRTTPARLHFRNIGLEAGVAYGEAGTMRAGMGVDAGDFDGDGRWDLVITNFQHEPISLYRNTGARTFAEVSYPSGVGGPSVLKLKFGVAFVDIDGDGRLDLYVGNGHVFDNVARFDDTASYAQTDQLYLNEGGGRFTEASGAAGPAFREAGVTRGVAVGDFDNNGTPDVLINRSGEPARLVKTEWLRPHAWIGFALRGTRSNRSAIGARVLVRTPAGLQMREVRSGSSYLSQSDLRPLFGLGDVTRPDQVHAAVRWPSGLVQPVPLTALNRYITVVEGRG